MASGLGWGTCTWNKNGLGKKMKEMQIVVNCRMVSVVCVSSTPATDRGAAQCAHRLWQGEQLPRLAHVVQVRGKSQCLDGLPSERAATRACGFTDLLDQGLHEQVAEECQRAEEKSLERCQHRDTSVDDAAIVIVVATDGLDRARGEDIVWLIDREWTGCCDTACGLRCD